MAQLSASFVHEDLAGHQPIAWSSSKEVGALKMREPVLSSERGGRGAVHGLEFHAGHLHAYILM